MANIWFDSTAYLKNKLAQLQKTEPSNPLWQGADAETNLVQVLAQNGYVGAEGQERHYQEYGANELVSPNAYFNVTEYLAAKAAQANANAVDGKTDWSSASILTAIQSAGMTVFGHFQQYGWKEGVNPSNAFDLEKYFEAKLAQLQNDEGADKWTKVEQVKEAFAAANLDPISHYAAHGKTEGVVVAPAQNPVEGAEGKTFTLTKDLDNVSPTGTMKTTDGNDTIVGIYEADSTGAETARSTLNLGDIIDGGAGTDTLAVTITGANTSNFALPASLKNIEVINVNNVASATTTVVDTSAVAGVTNLNVTNSVKGITAKAAATTDVNVAVAEQDGAVAVNGGKNVTVNVTDAVTAAAATTNTVTVGSTTAADQATGAVKVTQNVASTGATAAQGGNISVTGGKTVDVNVNAKINVADAAGTFGLTTGNIAVNSNVSTESVTVKQTGSVNKFQPAATTGPATTGTTSVKFVALAATETVTVGGLTFTAKSAMTAEQVAVAFANLTALDTQSSGGVVTNGVYTGALAATYTSGAASGDTVVFAGTTTTPITVSAAPAAKAPTATYTAGPDVTTTPAAVGGAVTYGDVDIAGGAALKTVSIDGYNATGSTITGGANNALTDVTLANGGAVTISSAAETLNLNLSAVNGGTPTTTAALAVNAGTKTLNVKGSGDAVNVSVTGSGNSVITANVAGTGTYTLGALGTAFTTLKVSDSANVTATGASSTLTSVDTTAGTGKVVATIDATKATYAGGAGVDEVSLLAAGGVANKAVSLGAGADKLDLSLFTGTFDAAVKYDGGEGSDVIKLSVTQASGATAAFAGQLMNFEKLELAADATAADLSVLKYNHVIANGGTAALTLSNLANGGTVEFKAANTALTTVNVLNAATGASDVLNLIANAANGTTIGTVAAAGVETINVSAIDTDSTAAVSTNTITVNAVDATVVNVTGAGNLVLNLGTSTKVTTVDGSTATGALTVGTLATALAATTVKGGSGADQLTANHDNDVLIGGAGNDTLTVADGKALVSLQGGAGQDTYKIGLVAGENLYSTISGTAAELSGDIIQFTTAAKILNTTGVAKIELASTAVFTDYLNEAVKGTTADAAIVSWFQFSGNTYVVQDNGAGATFDLSKDSVVEITGLVNLTYNDSGVLEIA